MRFLGTGACLFLGVNLCKVPFSAGLGLVHADTLRNAVPPAHPLRAAGTWAGLHTAATAEPVAVRAAVLAATLVSAVALVVR